jgi:hypothetical protein
MEQVHDGGIEERLAALVEQQRKFLTFASSQFAELFAMLETVLDVQRMMLAQHAEDFPAVTAEVQKILDNNREKHAQFVRERLEFVGFLGHKSEGPPS